jgi:DNA-binding MarR family transcriptional regulator
LEDAGFIEREVDPNDGRRAVLRLTRAGKRLDAQRAGTVEAAVQAALSALPHGKVRAAEDVLRQVASELELRWADSRSRQSSDGVPPSTKTRTTAHRKRK